MELGFLTAQKASLASVNPSHQAEIIGAQTGFMRLKALLRIAHIEDIGFCAAIRVEGDQVRVRCDVEGLNSHPFICLAEWLNLQAVVSIIGSVWVPLGVPAGCVS